MLVSSRSLSSVGEAEIWQAISNDRCNPEGNAMTDNNEEKGFSVKDRRVFSDDGEIRHEEPSDEEERAGQGNSASSGSGAEAKESPGDAAKKGEETPLPEINFASFILSLHTSVLFHFGDFKDPATDKTARNLPAAKQTIDLISILQEKTKGNLEEYEKNLIDEVLFELRMRYVKESKLK